MAFSARADFRFDIPVALSPTIRLLSRFVVSVGGSRHEMRKEAGATLGVLVFWMDGNIYSPGWAM